MREYRLHCAPFWVDVRLLEVGGKWIASANTANGPSLGCGTTSFDALWHALAPFDGLIGELLASMPSDVR